MTLAKSQINKKEANLDKGLKMPKQTEKRQLNFELGLSADQDKQCESKR